MHTYRFLTHWRFDTPVDRVWEELKDPGEWPSWWRGLGAVELLVPGDADGVGAVRRFTWRSRLPYDLTFDMTTTRVEKPALIEGTADGELRGRGTWRLTPASERATDVRYEWEVEVTKRWMRVLAPLARPLFAWNHDVVMRWGEEGLGERLARSAANAVGGLLPNNR